MAGWCTPLAACLIHRLKTVPDGSDPVGQFRCTRHLGLTVLGTETGSPAPGAAAIVPARQPCRVWPLGVTLSTACPTFMGARGLLRGVGTADPNGTIPFLLAAAGTGLVVCRDSWAARWGVCWHRTRGCRATPKAEARYRQPVPPGAGRLIKLGYPRVGGLASRRGGAVAHPNYTAAYRATQVPTFRP